jgi:phenylpyruvate tautomerase PptA (4-oxalocrotonate tautomerase family)
MLTTIRGCSAFRIAPRLALKRRIAASVVAAAERLGLSGEDVMIVFNETRWENWSFGGGRFFYT